FAWGHGCVDFALHSFSLSVCLARTTFSSRLAQSPPSLQLDFGVAGGPIHTDEMDRSVAKRKLLKDQFDDLVLQATARPRRKRRRARRARFAPRDGFARSFTGMRGSCNQEGRAYGRSKDRNGEFARKDRSHHSDALAFLSASGSGPPDNTCRHTASCGCSKPRK